jgi:hypothetical protein
MRLVWVALAFGFATLTTITGSSASAGPTHVPRLRPAGTAAQQLIDTGLSSSPTFRALANRLRYSDVIVYVEVRHDLPNNVGGSLRFMAKSATDRFLRVTINGYHSRMMQVALLGHELQHAVEVAGAPDVDSHDAMANLYRRIGVSVGRDAYDSAAARDAGYAIREEFRQRPADTRLARRTAAHEDDVLGGYSIAAN